MIPVLERVGKAAFAFYMTFVLLSFFLTLAYNAAGVPPPDVAAKHGRLPEFNASSTVANRTYDLVVKYMETSQSVVLSSIRVFVESVGYLAKAVFLMGVVFADLAHAFFDGTPLHGVMVPLAATAGFAIQSLAWMWIIGNLASLVRGG